MGANRPTHQHYIPKMLLKNFCDDEGGLWVVDQKRGNCYRSVPGKVFVQRNVNTRHVWIEGTDSYEHELALSRIESDAEVAVSSVMQQARAGCNPRLDEDLDRKLKEFVIAMARRTPESQERIFRDPGRNFEEMFNSVLKDRLANAGFEVPDQDFLDSDPDVLRIRRTMKANVRAQFAAGDHDVLQKDSESFVRETGWGVALICMPKRSFVIGSHGLTVIGEDASLAGSWLPVAHDVALLVTAVRDRGFRLVLDRRKDWFIKALNSATAAQSDMIAGRSKALVRSLTARSNRRA